MADYHEQRDETSSRTDDAGNRGTKRKFKEYVPDNTITRKEHVFKGIQETGDTPMRQHHSQAEDNIVFARTLPLLSLPGALPKLGNTITG